MSLDPKLGDEKSRNVKRLALRKLNDTPHNGNNAKLDSSLKRHTALIKRMKLSMAADNKDAILRETEGLSLERYIDELAQASLDGLGKCKLEKDVWGAVEIISALHRRFPAYSAAFVRLLSASLTPPTAQAKAELAKLTPEQREKEDSVRISKQRPLLRVASELVLVGIIRDPGPEWVIKVLKDLLSNDPTLSSLPLLSTFLRSYSYPYLGIIAGNNGETETQPSEPEEDLVEPEIRDRFKRMCEGYFETVSKKLVIEHRKLLALDARNHEAYIRSGEIFEDRQQAYEKAARGYEKITAGCAALADLLSLKLPDLPTSDATTATTIGVNTNPSSSLGNNGDDDDEFSVGNKSKWVDDEERKFYEDIADLKDFVPRSVLGIEEELKEDTTDEAAAGGNEAEKAAKSEDEEVRQLQEELERLGMDNNDKKEDGDDDGEESDGVATPKPSLSPLSPTTALPNLPTTQDVQAPTETQGDLPSQSQMLTTLLAKLPDCTSRQTIDTAAIDFAFINSKAARKRVVKFLAQPPKNRLDLLPYYARFVATLSKYMPDVGTELIAILDEEFRYLQKKKKVVVELAESRLRNTTYLAHLTKFSLLPPHVILHMTKVCLDGFSGTSIDVLTILIEGCGRFLLRDEVTAKRFAAMLELCRRKMKMGGLEERRIMGLENAYYQCNPPERAPRIEKARSDIELFVRHLIHDVLSKKTLDKVLKLLRKLDWTGANVKVITPAPALASAPLETEGDAKEKEEDTSADPITPKIPPPHIPTLLHRLFTKPHKLRFSQVPLLAMLLYDLQRYHPDFVVGVVDQVLEDIRLGLEGRGYGLAAGAESTTGANVVGVGSSGSYGYEMNQKRVAQVRYVGEMYVYRLVGSGVIFDLLWRLVCFGHADGRPLPHVPSPLDMPDDFFRIRLVCVLLDTCGMCFDRGPQKKKLDSFLVFFQYYIHCKSEMPMDIEFMVLDSLEAVRPSFRLVKTVEEAAIAVDDLMNTAFQGADPIENEESGDESGGEDNPERRDGEDDDDEDEGTSPTTPTGNIDGDRPPSPDQDVVMSASNSMQENFGPSEEADAEFAKELAKLVSESSAERKVDKKTALAMLESNMLPTSMRRKKGGWDDDGEEEDGGVGDNVMKFTVVTKKGNKQQTRQLAVPSSSALAVHTRSAQLQDKVEQQQLKRLVLDYEQREEAEEMKAIEARNRAGAIKIRYVG